jgi:hypothetical protein
LESQKKKMNLILIQLSQEKKENKGWFFHLSHEVWLEYIPLRHNYCLDSPSLNSEAQEKGIFRLTEGRPISVFSWIILFLYGNHKMEFL